MGLVCSGRCGQDTVGPEPDARSPMTPSRSVPEENTVISPVVTTNVTPLASTTDTLTLVAKATSTAIQQEVPVTGRTNLADGKGQQEPPSKDLALRHKTSASTSSRSPTTSPRSSVSRDSALRRYTEEEEGEEEQDYVQPGDQIFNQKFSMKAPTCVPLAVNGRKKMNHFDHIPSQQVTGEMVGQYLRAHPEFLEAWLMEQVELETLERWMIRRTQRAQHKNQENGSNGKITRKTSLSRWKFCVHADKRKMLQELTQSLQVSPNKGQVLRELAHCIASACSAEEFNLYLLDTSSSSLIYCPDPRDGSLEQNPWRGEVVPETWLCTFVASTKETVKTTIAEADPRFPLGIAVPATDAFYAISVPVVQSDGELIAVLELFRKEQGEAFHEEDEEIINSYMVWGGIALHYAELYHNMAKQRKLNDFILSVVKSIFQDMVSMDTLIMKVMNFAQKLVNADRASLFLVDSKNRELFARIFDMGNTFDENKPPQASKEIRFSIGTGIAGIVAQTGEVLSISDAYSDPRFNRHVDQQTGYVTKSILCMPIFIRGNVIGVMQMVNKKQGNFTKEDEESFEMFAVYCGLALHHAKLYDKIRRSEQKYKVALEVMSYHSSCGEEDLSNIVKEGIPDDIPGVDDYYFSHLSLDDMDKVRHAIYMFVDLFGLSRFDRDSLIRFTLTVKKNYRRVPYHNWTHGFSVANSMYTIIKHTPKTFRPLECLALYIGSLCHDLDHRGKNNKFMLETESPLAAIYTTSTLEHHHFNQTVTILQQEGHNIFSKLTPSEYKQVLGNIKHCILATDLALFFPNKAKLAQLLAENKFDWSNIEHRLLIEAIAMTACDLCASAKPWDVQVETVKVIFEEFYEQGDAEKAAGKSPIPMMDRDKTDEQPASQVGFLSGICIPCYELLFKVIPNTKPFLDGCKDNFSKWQALAHNVDEQKKSQVPAEDEGDKRLQDPGAEEGEVEVKGKISEEGNREEDKLES